MVDSTRHPGPDRCPCLGINGYRDVLGAVLYPSRNPNLGIVLYKYSSHRVLTKVLKDLKSVFPFLRP